jgi:hypothetical protein
VIAAGGSLPRLREPHCDGDHTSALCRASEKRDHSAKAVVEPIPSTADFQTASRRFRPGTGALVPLLIPTGPLPKIVVAFSACQKLLQSARARRIICVRLLAWRGHHAEHTYTVVEIVRAAATELARMSGLRSDASRYDDRAARTLHKPGCQKLRLRLRLHDKRRDATM